MEILELKQKLELAINERLQEFKDRADRYAELATQLEHEHRFMILIATELKSVEYMVRASGNDTHADLVDQLLVESKKGECGNQEIEKMPLLAGKKKR